MTKSNVHDCIGCKYSYFDRDATGRMIVRCEYGYQTSSEKVCRRYE